MLYRAFTKSRHRQTKSSYEEIFTPGKVFHLETNHLDNTWNLSKEGFSILVGFGSGIAYYVLPCENRATINYKLRRIK
jgi:hypothetical protein